MEATPSTRLWQIGDREAFAVDIALTVDPSPEDVEPELATSWGSFALWIDGRNVCAHRTQGADAEAVEWYLLPLLEWAASNWDALLHEGRLPGVVSGIAAAQSMSILGARLPLDAVDEFAHWQAWWRRHNVQAAADGGLFPNVYLRRRLGAVEISWDSRHVEWAPEHFAFLDPSGHAVEDPDVVGRVLWEMLDVATTELLERSPGSSRVVALREQVDRLRDEKRSDYRAALIAGLGRSPRQMWDSWRRAVEALTDSATRNALTRVPHSELVVTGSAVAPVMFGSLAPSIGERDVVAIARVLLAASGDGPGESDELRTLVREQPLASDFTAAWGQGYSLAEEVHEALQTSTDGRIDVHAIIERLDINVQSARLSDATVRGLCFVSSEHRPTIVVNLNFEHGVSRQVQRFTLAHELCHLLCDRAQGQALAISSGNWAPRDVERRANAFAAMFVAPRPLVRAAVSSATVPPERFDGLVEIARLVDLPLITLIHHLSNLGEIDEEAGQSLLGRVEAMNAASAAPNPYL